MQLPLQARRPGTWWDAPVLIRRVTTPPSRAVRGKIYEPPPRFRSPSDHSCVFLPGPRPPVPRRFPWNPSGCRGACLVARTAERTGSGVAYWRRGRHGTCRRGNSNEGATSGRRTQGSRTTVGRAPRLRGHPSARLGAPNTGRGCGEHKGGRGRGPGHPTRPRFPPED